MFGLGKLIGGLAGGLLDKIGLGFLTPFVSLAVDYFTGNYAAMIGDLTNLVGQFSDSSFLKNLSKFQPLGMLGQGGFSGLSSLGNLDVLRGTAQTLGLDKVDKMFDLVQDFGTTLSTIQQNREMAYFGRLN